MNRTELCEVRVTNGKHTFVLRYEAWRFQEAWDRVIAWYDRGWIGQLQAAELIESIRKARVA